MGKLRVKPAVVAASVAFIVASCTIMPASGPAGPDVRAGERNPKSLPYALVKIAPPVISVLASNAPELGREFHDTRSAHPIVFGVGDVVAVTIFEAAAGGLFVPAEAGVRPGNFVTLPNQSIDNNGNISVPYAGQIRAAGRTPPQVANEIVNALKNRAIEPQAVIGTVAQNSSLISVLGDVGSPARFPANANGEHILDSITRAGGPHGQGYDEWVMLQRDGHREIVPFGSLLYEPRLNNIWTHPNDTIYLYNEPQTFVAFGASGTQGQFPFGAWQLSLAEGLAKAGGLNNSVAEPANVFLYRGETRDVATQLGIDCSKYQGPIIPVVYVLNLRDPAGYFLATKFQMRNKDVIYTSDADSVNATKAMIFFQTVVATASDPIAAATSVYTLKSVASGTASLVTTPTVTTTAAPTTP